MIIHEKMPLPIVFFDLETTGIDKENDRIVEIAMVRIDNDHGITTFNTRIDPLVSIPSSASDIHGITDEMVENCPTFKGVIEGIMAMLDGNCAIGGFNSNNFDVPFLYAEIERAGHAWDWKKHLYVDASVVFKRNEERTLSAASKFYLEETLEGAHGALADTMATLKVFNAQLGRYPDLPSDSSELEKYCNFGEGRVDISGKFKRNEKGEIVFAFGKNKGVVAKNDTGYLWWMAGANFSKDTIDCCKKIIDGTLT